jgi:hypothetical protein
MKDKSVSQCKCRTSLNNVNSKRLSFFTSAVTLSLALFLNVYPIYAASSVYIPGVPSASSSSIGISCNYNGLGAGTVYCQNQSPGLIVTCNGSNCSTSAGYQNRLIFTPGSYGWTIPAGTTKAKVVVIGPGGNSGGGGGGYAEKTFTGLSGNAVIVTVYGGGAGPTGTASVQIGGTTVSAGGGSNGAGAGGCGANGDINTCGGSSVGLGGGGAGGPYANGGNAGGGGGGGFGNGITSWGYPDGQNGGYSYGSRSNLLGSNGVFWYVNDIMGQGGIEGTNGANGYQVAGTNGTDGQSGGLGGGGGQGGTGGNTTSGGWGNGGNGGNGGFGGGGGLGGQGSSYGYGIAGNGGAGGIGGGGGVGAYGYYGNGAAGVGGNGIAIIYW